VVLILGGIVIGPQVLGWAEPDSSKLFANVGLGFLFLLAGYELDLRLFRERPGRLAIAAWLVSVAVACGVVGLLELAGLVRAFVPVAIGLTTTALGTLLPILRDNDMVSGRFGRYLLAAGAVGEFLPILAIAILLGANGKFIGLISLAAVGVIALLLTLAPRLISDRIQGIMRAGEHATAQTTLRWTVALLLLLLVVANDFGIDIVLGAFLAGVVLRRWGPGDVHSLEEKLDAVGYGFFIPIFFVSSGMGLDLDSIVEAPFRLLLFFALLLAVRGLPTLLIYRSALPRGAAGRADLPDRDRVAAAGRPQPDRPGDRDHAAGERGRPGRSRGALGGGVPRRRGGDRPPAPAYGTRGPAGGGPRAGPGARFRRSGQLVLELGDDDPGRRLDEREVGERPRRVPQVPAGPDVELRGVEPERGDDRQQPLHRSRARCSARRWPARRPARTSR
jgi:Kef-type K+ transport system membrane component KefB